MLEVRSSLYTRSFSRYMQEVFTTWQGDARRAREVLTRGDLERVIDEMKVKQGFVLQAYALPPTEIAIH